MHLFSYIYIFIYMREKFLRCLSKKPICCVYSVTNNINNKVYIGQSIDVERRWSQHKYGKGNLILKNAIKKYGLNNFEFKILEEVLTDKKNKNQIIEELTKIEQKWFDLKKPYLKENGYNIQKTSKPNLTPNRDKNFGEKISKIKIDNNHTGKPVNQYDLNGKFIKEWKSAAEIERVLGYKSENISATCLGKQKSSNYFIWKFKAYILKDEDVENANSSLRLSIVRQYDLEGNLLGTFKNIKEASLLTNIKESIIREACNGNHKTGFGFIWKFKNQPLLLNEHKRNNHK